MNREQWLINATDILRDTLFKQAGFSIPRQVKISVGFPLGCRSGKVIGQHFAPFVAEDNVSQIYISPIIGDGVRALDILVHELCHAVVGNANGHNKIFAKCAKSVGLTGKMTQTIAGPTLTNILNLLIRDKLGPYPHSKLSLNDGRKKQKSRMIKLSCKCCGYIVRTVRTNLDEKGPVICPCNNVSMSE